MPYQVSVMTIYEVGAFASCGIPSQMYALWLLCCAQVYRMNIPLFVPSQKLLLRWQTDHLFVWVIAVLRFERSC
jgi:hypothetical protein